MAQLAMALPQEWKQMTFTSADDNIAQLEQQAKQRQALLRGVQLPVDTYDRLHELRLYKKVADTLDMQPGRNKLATFAAVARALNVKGIRVLEAVAASGSLESAAGVTVDDLCNPGAARSDFVDRLATMAVAYGMAADGMSEQALREQIENILQRLGELEHDILAYRYSVHTSLGRPLTRKEVAELYAARLGFDSKEVQSYASFAMAVVRKTLGQAVQC